MSQAMKDGEVRATPTGFFVHKTGDHVGVAVRDIKKGERVVGYMMDTEAESALEVVQDVPLGHKIALEDLPEGAEVVEYGTVIGRTATPITKGQWVHVHNIRSARW